VTLRTRLVLGLLVLAALALALSGFATSRALEGFLLDRVDDELRSSAGAVAVDLDDSGGGGRRPPVPVPNGTVGELRDASGEVVARRAFTLSGTTEAVPDVSPELAAGVTSPTILTADAVGEGWSFRVLIRPERRSGGSVLVAIPLEDLEATVDRLLLIQLLVAGVTLALLAVATWVLVRRALHPLDRMGEAAGRIAGGDLSGRVAPAEPRTEVGRLGLALNRMLEEIERAFAAQRASEERLRRFLADASHELRTPLASIRGYAELFRRGADRRPEDLAVSMRRIEEESARMGELVEGMLQLARLDEGAEPELVTGAVDLTGLAEDACRDLRAAAPDREVSLDAPGPVVVEGDASRLRQVVANLLANAAAHTPAGTPVEVSVGAGEHATLTVTDHGPGLDEDALAHAFERLWRGDESRGRGGSGLGLAIVRAIVTAHGGEVRAENAPGAGARLTVTLPLRAALSDDSQGGPTGD
jgi:two-component system OmpR family sensor kinase